MDLQGKFILVTGASSGIGKAIAIAFARKHAHVFVHYGRNKIGAQDTLGEIEKTSSGRLCQADLMDPAAIKVLFEEIRRTTPKLDALINNAGDARPGDVAHHWADTTKARAFAGYDARIPIREGLERYVEWATRGEGLDRPAEADVVRNW